MLLETNIQNKTEYLKDIDIFGKICSISICSEPREKILPVLSVSKENCPSVETISLVDFIISNVYTENEIKSQFSEEETYQSDLDINISNTIDIDKNKIEDNTENIKLENEGVFTEGEQESELIDLTEDTYENILEEVDAEDSLEEELLEESSNYEDFDMSETEEFDEGDDDFFEEEQIEDFSENIHNEESSNLLEDNDEFDSFLEYESEDETEEFDSSLEDEEESNDFFEEDEEDTDSLLEEEESDELLEESDELLDEESDELLEDKNTGNFEEEVDNLLDTEEDFLDAEDTIKESEYLENSVSELKNEQISNNRQMEDTDFSFEDVSSGKSEISVENILRGNTKSVEVAVESEKKEKEIPHDVVQYLKLYNYSDVSEVLQYYSKKEIDMAIITGRIFKLKNKLYI